MARSAASRTRSWATTRGFRCKMRVSDACSNGPDTTPPSRARSASTERLRRRLTIAALALLATGALLVFCALRGDESGRRARARALASELDHGPLVPHEGEEP